MYVSTASTSTLSSLPTTTTHDYPPPLPLSPHTPPTSRPPPLNYTLTRTRKRTIAIFSTLICIEAGVLPLILFYSIRWGAHLSNTTNMTIVTCLVGTYSGHKISMRMWHMLKSAGHEQRQPIGAGRWGVDAFAIWIGIAMFCFFMPLIVGSSLDPASVRTVSMALPFFMLILSLPTLTTALFPHRLRLPFRVSSLPPYHPLPPLTYTLVEDIVAVDGGGCLAFRHAWRARYERSPVMRRVLRATALAWGASGCAVAGALIGVAWNSHADTAYGCGYGVPWVWAGAGAAGTVWWVRRELEREGREWEDGDGEGGEERGERGEGKYLSLDIGDYEKFDGETIAREVEVRVLGA